MASRDQTCINASVKLNEHDEFLKTTLAEKSSSSITTRCKELLATEGGCIHRNELKRFDYSSASKIRSIVSRSSIGEVWDLEDLVQVGSRLTSQSSISIYTKGTSRCPTCLIVSLFCSKQELNHRFRYHFLPF